MTERPTITIDSPPGGWGPPWPNVAELAAALPHHKWTLVGGLMTQLHAINVGIDTVRTTNDVDIVLHIETSRGVAAATANVLESLGYQFIPPADARHGLAHRFTRGDATVDRDCFGASLRLQSRDSRSWSLGPRSGSFWS